MPRSSPRRWYVSFRSPFYALAASADAAKLRAAGLGDDIAVCARDSVLDVVPTVIGAGGGVATVCATAATGDDDSRARRDDDTVRV